MRSRETKRTRGFTVRVCLQPGNGPGYRARIRRGAISGRCLAAAAGAAGLLLATGAAAAPLGEASDVHVSWAAAQNPFLLTFLVGGVPRVAETDLGGGPGGRLSYRLADGSFHGVGALLATSSAGGATHYRVATDEPGRTATVDVVPTATGASVTFSLQPATGVVATFEAFAGAPGEHFLGGGERPVALDLSGQSVAVKTAYSCANTMPAPFFLSSRGYGVALTTASIAAMAFPGATLSDSCAGGAEPRCPLAAGFDVAQLCSKSTVLSYNLFVGTPPEIVSAYVATIGRPQLPPPSQFALIKWRDVVSGPAQLNEDVDRLHALGIPIGWVLLDNPWETANCYGTMTFDPERFPDPTATVRGLHARGVRVMLWISPLIRREYCPPPPQYASSALLGNGGKASTLDLTDPATRSTFEAGLRKLIDLGVDGFKADRGDEIDLEALQLAGGPGVDLHNAYPLLYARAVAEAIAASGRAASFATLFRAGAPGSAALVPGFWGGDQAGTFTGLQQAIHDGLSAGLSGYAIWGSDTGGYGATESAEVLVRWAQFSALTPVFEVGGTGGNATLWDYGSPTVDLFRAAAVLHYELFPYLYSLARTAHASGLPILRPLALEYPADPVAWQQDLEVLVGDNLLAAPVTAPEGTPTSIHLPQGTWVDLTSGGRVTGPASLTATVPLSKLPLYLRAGSVIPFAARTPSIWKRPWPTDALQLRGRGGWLYAPAAGGAFGSTPDFGSFRATRTGRTLTLVLWGAPRETQVLLAGVGTPASVRIDGAPVARSLSDTSLRIRATGWRMTRAPFPGVVLKLAPRRGTATVTVTLR
jgi:alpha-D-xyloside xylohydrolase